MGIVGKLGLASGLDVGLEGKKRHGGCLRF